MSYDIDLIDLYRRAASHFDRILQGTRPGEFLRSRIRLSSTLRSTSRRFRGKADIEWQGIGKTVFCARDGIGGISGALWAAVTEAGSNRKEHASAAGLASGMRRKKQGKVKDLNSTDY